MRPCCLRLSLEEWGVEGALPHTPRWAFFSLAPSFLVGPLFTSLPSLCGISLSLPLSWGQQRQRARPQHRISFLPSGQHSWKSPRAGFGCDPVRPRCSPFCFGHLNTVQPLLPSHHQPCEEFHPINSSTSPWQHKLLTLLKIGDRSTDARGA